MNDLERILDDCIERLTNGTSTLEECLSAHPEYAARLQHPLESASGLLHHRMDISVSPLVRARGRAKLSMHMQQHPRQRGQRVLLFQRLAMGLAVVMFALLSVGTVRAQSALPADMFYSWKLASEQVWRTVSFNSRHVDLALADRRVSEIVATADDPSRLAGAVHDYQEILLRLEAGSDADRGEILSTLETHQKSLKDAGLSIQALDDYLAPLEGERIIPDLPQTPLDDSGAIEIPPLIP